MKKFDFIVIIQIYFVFFGKCYSNEFFNSFDLLPFAQNKSIHEFSVYGSDEIGFEHERLDNASPLKLNSLLKLNYGSLNNNFDKFEIFSNIEISKNSYLRYKRPLNLDDKALKIDFTIKMFNFFNPILWIF